MAQVRSLPRDPAPPGGRVPPHNLEAEESVLGSMLLSKSAVGEALEILEPEDFYREANQAICECVRDLFGHGEPIDAITVSEELRRRSVLEAVGGIAYIHQLVASVPTAANAVYYGKIVSELATLRRLIDAATQVAQDCYEVPEDIEAAVNRAEELIFAVAGRRIHQDFQPLRALLSQTMEHIDMLASRQTDVTGVPTGYIELDRLLGGLQKANLILVAARPSMGKSTLVMNIAQYVSAVEGIPAAIFSLEMSWMEIVQRLICAEARVDTMKIRSGHMGEADWNRVSHSVGKLAEAPLYIDDTPSISMGEIRAKCRRLKSKHGLGLVIVDYIQLMTSPRRTENRVQEVSEISRSLKILAKELDVPVVAVSQLSRQPEQQGRGSRRPRLADLRECVTGDTLVCLADGRRVPIRDLVGQAPRVLSLSPEGTIIEADSDLVWEVGVRPVFNVRLASGRRIRATGEHRLLAGSGWRTVSELRPGDRLACARSLPEPRDFIQWPEEHIVLLAHLIGDGSYITNQPLRYTTGSNENSAIVANAARSFGVTVNRHEAPRGNWHQLVFSGNGNRWHHKGINKWLRDLGIYGQRSHGKRVPDDVFRFCKEDIATFLQHLWATDGTIYVRRSGRGGHGVAFATCSRELADDVSALLLRLGIVARIYTVRGPNSHWYHVVVSGAESQRRFLSRVGAFGPRRWKADELTEALRGVVPNTNVDTLPQEIFARVLEGMAAAGLTGRDVAAMRGTAYGGSSHFQFAPSRGLVAQYADILADERLSMAATNDLFWDRIVAIDYDGEEPVFDLTVPGPASWIADSIISHNSGALEQDADVVMFVYREEKYDPETPKKGEAEIIVEKHRNGPTGTISLAFLGQYTKFENLART